MTHWPTHLLTGVKCRATSVAKKNCLKSKTGGQGLCFICSSACLIPGQFCISSTFPLFFCWSVCFRDLHLRLILRGWACMRVHKDDIWGSSNKCTGGWWALHTPRLILNNFLIAGTQLFHSDCNLYHSIDMAVRLVCYQILPNLLYTHLFTKGLSSTGLSFLDFHLNTNIAMSSPVFFLWCVNESVHWQPNGERQE